MLYGPPGTGKTQAGVLGLARGWFERGARPTEVAYLAFTKAAAKAACTRILESDEEVEADALRDQFPYFRTLHSLAFMGLHRARPGVRVLKTADMKRFAEATGLGGVFAVHEWEDLADVYAKLENRGRTAWDQAKTAYCLSRISATSPAELDAARVRPSSLANQGDFIEEPAYRAFVLRYEAHKKANGLVDFEDMLEFALREMAPMDEVRYVILDEAQDLCPLHHAIIDRLFASAEEVWWIGDDDQALYKFSGASAELFLSRAERADRQLILQETHRFGQAIVDFSARIIRRVAKRMPKEIVGARGRGGTVSFFGEFRPVPGNVLVMHRHVEGCRRVAEAYMAEGLPFRNERGLNPLGAPLRKKGWVALDALARGERAPVGLIRLLAEEILPSVVADPVGDTSRRLVVHGGKKKLASAALLPMLNLDDLKNLNILTAEGAQAITQRLYSVMDHPDDLAYYDRLTQNGHDLDDRGATITTIHGAKGREADLAVVFTEMGQRCWKDPDTEHRLAYVASTRTRSDLLIYSDSKVEWATQRYDYPEDGEGEK